MGRIMLFGFVGAVVGGVIGGGLFFWQARGMKEAIPAGAGADGNFTEPPVAPAHSPVGVVDGATFSTPPIAPSIAVGESFFAQIPMAFKFPILLKGLLMLIAATVFIGFARLASSYGAIGLGANLIIMGYVSAYMFEIVLTTANGENEPPDFPEFSGMWDSILRPFFLIVGTAFIYFAPLGLALVNSVWEMFTGSNLIPFADVLLHPLSVILFTGIGVACFPMAMLAVIMFNSIVSVNPLIVFPAIFRIFLPYMVVCGLLAVAIGIEVLFRVVLIVVVPDFIGIFLGQLISLYFVMVDMRLLGLLYRTHKEKLAWF